MEECAPVVIFAYKRLDHLKELIHSLEKNLLSAETGVYIFSDNAKDSEELTAVNKTREYLSNLATSNPFRFVKIEFASEHKGLAESVIHGVDKIINQYGRAIVVEDDLYLASDFLHFMNGALSFYENVENVWSVSGYTPSMKALKNYPHDVYYSYRPSSWGWATWKNRWSCVDWSVKHYTTFLRDKEWKKKFNRGGKDLSGMLIRQMRGEIDSWAIRWCFAQSSNNMFCVYPTVSRVLNKGCDGTGTHCGKSNAYDTIITDDVGGCNYEILLVNRKIVHEIYLQHTDTFMKKIKRNICKR